MPKGHTSTRRGRKVYIVLMDGTVIIDKFIERTLNKWIVLEQHGRIHVRDIKSLSDYRAQQYCGAQRK